jgi:dimethylglycine dehydrogenase
MKTSSSAAPPPPNFKVLCRLQKIPLIGYTASDNKVLHYTLTNCTYTTADLPRSSGEQLSLLLCLSRWMEDEARRGRYDVMISNETDLWGCLGLAGPASRDLLGPLIGVSGSGAGEQLLLDDRWPFLHARRITVAGVDTLAVRISYTGELGWELYARRDDLPAIYDALIASRASVAPAIDFGTYALNALRIEKGFRAWGSEMNVDVDPFEAGLDPFIRLDKPADFTGRAAARALRANGQRRRLAMLYLANSGAEIEDFADANGNEAVWFGDRIVGNTTSGAYGPTVGRSLLFAYLPTELTVPGTEVHVELIGQRQLAVVEPGPSVMVESSRTKAARRRLQQSHQQEEQRQQQ